MLRTLEDEIPAQMRNTHEIARLKHQASKGPLAQEPLVPAKLQRHPVNPDAAEVQ
jgi:hypothetical protein